MTMTMTTVSDETDGRACRRLNRLILACNDSARAQSSAATIVSGSERRGDLEDGASRRIAFIDALSEEVRRLGGTADEGGTAFEALRAAASWFRTQIVGENGGDSYSTCARIEAAAARLYVTALDDPRLPERARRLVTEQHEVISADHDRLRRRSMGG